MFRIWAKMMKENRLVKDLVISNNDSTMARTKKVFSAIDEICDAFDLSKPLWLDSTVADFKKHDRTRFTKDNFIDAIEFDFLEIQMLEED